MKKLFLLLILGLFCLSGCAKENATKPELTLNSHDVTTQDAANVPSAPTTEAPSEIMQGRLDVAGAIVQVYDGSQSTSDHLTDPIWSKEYSSCHAGNGQVSIVYRDGLAYLLESCLWQGQGFTGYYHTALFWGETGLQYTKDEYSLQFYETDYSREEQIALVLDFKEQLAPWLNDAQLLVATAVELNKQFVTTENEQYIPQDYYDIVWQRWKE